ncbi:dGTPase [Methanococcus maripaludis]|uniref:dGTPase n=1 Tax=Methanococcus maripaludis TaxID=39152 RepID=A0A7J9S7F9_METMI|nr:dGTPase [Methanococcus maripaludis]
MEVNENLAEAMSLGHDLGHTPFGHQGERVLDEIFNGTENLGGKLKNIDYGGFKHNFQALRILTNLEHKSMDYEGINLTWQVLEGILKHTRTCRQGRECIKKGKKCENKCLGNWDINRFVNDQNLIKKLHLNYGHSVTMEGQIVQIADEIAQRQHDLDDGLRDTSLGIKPEDLCRELINFCDTIILEYPDCDEKELLGELKNKLDKNFSMEHDIPKKILYFRDIIVRDVIEYFILDVVSNTFTNISKLNPRDYKLSKKERIVKKEVVMFSNIGKKFNDMIEGYIKSKILNSYSVNRFDGKAIFIVKQIFKAYYTNPRQMPGYIIKNIIEKTSKNFENVDIAVKKDGKEFKLSEINILESKPEEVKIFLEFLKLNIVGDFTGSSGVETYTESDFKNIIKNRLAKGKNWGVNSKKYPESTYKIVKKVQTDMPEKELVYDLLINNNHTYLSIICDYVAGMTDNFAKEEYKKLYQV